MTDKQIIIDVSKCKEYGLRNCEGKLIHWCHTYDDHCQDFDNCYYKQLKRKEQECEELKTMLKDLSFENQKFCYQIEEQTKQLEPFKDEYFKSLDNVVIAGLAKKSIRLTAENRKLEQTLTEIKEIAESYNHYSAHAPVSGYSDILQKISECEGNDETN